VEKSAKSKEHKTGIAHPEGEQENAAKGQEHLEEDQDSLAARLRTGNRSAATELVDGYYEQIYLYMRRLGHDRQMSEDLTQETFLRAWHHIGQLRDGKALNGWLYRIAGNVSKLYWRKRKATEPRGAKIIDVIETGETEHDKISRDEELHRLNEAVSRLPRKFGQAIVLHYMQHLTIAQAAQAAGVRQGTFKSRLNRALKVLRKQLI